MKRRTLFVGTLIAAGLLAITAFSPAVAQAGAKKRVFVYADDAAHERALIAIANRGLRHEFVSPGNELTFSAELTDGQIGALERLGAGIEAVPQVYPMKRERRYGALRQLVTPSAKPFCGDGICKGKENYSSCPEDCTAETPEESERVCYPQDQREYQTLLLSGTSGTPPEGELAGADIKLLIIDTGVYKGHPDLDVAFCRNATGRKIRNNCKDEIGHGTHVAGSAAGNGGSDAMGLFGTAPGVILGVEKICGALLCFLDDLIRGIEDGVAEFHPDVISLSFSGADIDAFRFAVEAAVADGALFLSSAGNEGPLSDTITYPASDANVVAVGMLDAARIANRMSSRGDEVELTGGGFVIESTAPDGCYTIKSGTSMSTPSVAGFAAANWKGDNVATRAYLRDWLGAAEDVNNSGPLGDYAPLDGYDDGTALDFDTVTGYGMPRTEDGIDGGNSATVAVDQTSTSVAPGETVKIVVNGGLANADSTYRIGVTSPSGDWTYGEFTTDDKGDSVLFLTPWTDSGTWLLTIDFGSTAAGFDADFDTFVQTL